MSFLFGNAFFVFEWHSIGSRFQHVIYDHINSKIFMVLNKNDFKILIIDKSAPKSHLQHYRADSFHPYAVNGVIGFHLF